jgi:hypothetical protein
VKHSVLCYILILMSVLMLVHEGAGAATTRLIEASLR